MPHMEGTMTAEFCRGVCVQMRVEIMSIETCMTSRDCPATVSYCVICVHVWSQSKTTTPYHTHVCAWKSNPRSSWRRVSFMKVDGVIDKFWAQFDDMLQHDNMPKCANTCWDYLKLSLKVKQLKTDKQFRPIMPLLKVESICGSSQAHTYVAFFKHIQTSSNSGFANVALKCS